MKTYAFAIGSAILSTVLVLAFLQVLRERNIDPVGAIARFFRPGAMAAAMTPTESATPPTNGAAGANAMA